MKKGIPNDITGNDGKTVVTVKSFADLEILKEHKKNNVDVRIIMHPNDCTDPYLELVEKMKEILGNPDKITHINFTKEAKN